ncbi:MAG: helix-turn-helix transcriptional regulator [Novosphingobium sp.]|nr:helix-turn-helix transcriptional regulator [Novosphingobium sp.]
MEEIMMEEGYAGVSSRKVAARAGLKSKLIHYYFRTMDDLFIAAFQRREDAYYQTFSTALTSSHPLHELWKLGLDAAAGKLVIEYNAAASHRPKLRQIIGRSARGDRLFVSGALTSIFDRYGIDSDEFPPKVVSLLMAGLARALATERALNTDEGHAEALAFAEKMLDRFEPRDIAGKPASRAHKQKKSGVGLPDIEAPA